MRIKFDEVMRESNDNYMKELSAAEIGKRLALQNKSVASFPPFKITS